MIELCSVQMFGNPNLCCFICLKPPSCLSFSLNGFEIDHVDKFDNLNLSVECHIDGNLNSIGIKIARVIGLLRKLKHRQLHKYCNLFITHSYCHIRCD